MMKLLVALWSLAMVPAASGVAILESTALMDWVWQPEDLNNIQVLSVPALYELETATGAFLTNLFQAAEDELDNTTNEQQDAADSPLPTVAGLFEENPVLSVSLQTRQQLERNGRQVLETVVSCQYLSFDGLSIDLPAILVDVVAKNEPSNNAAEALRESLESFIGVSGSETLSFSFRAFDDSKVLETVDGLDDDSHSKADKGLIVATTFLSIMVLVVSSVLLYITGGWTACQRRMNNCLFEEIEDEYDMPNKISQSGTRSYDEEEGDESSCEASVETGVATNPSGILGVESQDDDPMSGLGIKTPSRGIYNDDVDMTPMSEMTSNEAPLGITSMRKLPALEKSQVEEGGLASMIMERMAKATAYNNSKVV